MIYKCIVAYDGTDFHGWQRQSHSKSVQGTLERIISKITGQKIEIHGSGRTDAGVHAEGQCFSFEANLSIPLDKFKYALNNALPTSVVISEITIEHEDFHARYFAVAKEYTYTIHQGKDRDPFVDRFAWFVPQDLDLEKMRRAACSMRGKKDFRSFMASGSNKEDTVRTIFNIDIIENKVKEGHKIIVMTFHGDGFLYNMVRIMAGLLVHVGLGWKTIEDVEAIIKGTDRQLVTFTAPACGLSLKKVIY